MGSYTIYSFMPGVCNLAWLFWDSPVLFQVTVACSFLLLNKTIPLYGCTTFCFSIRSLMDGWLSSAFWLQRIMVWWTFVYKCLFESLLSLLWSIYLEVELIDHMVIMCLMFSRNHHIIFYSSAQRFRFPSVFANVCYFLFFQKLFKK